MSIIQQLLDLKEWSKDSTRYERRLAFRGNLPSTEAGTIPLEFDELSPQEQEYYQNPPFSTHPDFLGAKGGSAQLVQHGPGYKPGGLVEPGVMHYARPVSEDRMAQLNEAAKKYGYESFDDIKDRQIKTNVSKEATRRAEGVVEGKGKTKPTEAQKVTMKEKHWTKTKSKADVKKIISSKAYKTYHLRRVADQINILKAVESGKYKTADQIRKAVGLDKEVFDQKVSRLFKNVYTQIGNMNTKRVRTYVTEEFLPKDLNKLEKIRDQLGVIEGFQSTEQRNIFNQIEEAYGQNGKTPNRKAYDISRKKAANFYKVSNEINRKYPKLNLELDHPLDYKTIEGLGKKGEKFLYVTPLDRSINRGFKEVLGKRYAGAIKAGDKQLMLRIENLAKDLGTTVGKVRGTSQVAEYGTTLLRESDLGEEIISSLRQQNVIADKVAEMTKSGELKTRLTEIEVKTPKNYNIGKVSKKDLKGVAKILKDANIPCIKGVGGQCNSPEDFKKGFNEVVERAAANDKTAISKLQKFTKTMKKLKGPAKWTGYGILGEIGFMVPFGVADYTTGESWKRIMGNASDWGFGPMFGQSEDEEIIANLPEGSLGAEGQEALAASERLRALEDPNRNFPKGRIGMDPQRFEESQIKVMQDAALDLRNKINPFMEGPRNEYLNIDKADQSMMDWAAAQEQIKANKLQRIQERRDRGFIAEEGWEKNFRTGRMGGGIAGIRRPWAIPPESGPMPQGGGLSSQFNRVRKLTG
jgi:hypothetical protein